MKNAMEKLMQKGKTRSRRAQAVRQTRLAATLWLAVRYQAGFRRFTVDGVDTHGPERQHEYRSPYVSSGRCACRHGGPERDRGAVPRPKPRKPSRFPGGKLGKTGVEITILEQGTVLGSGFDRILRTSYAGGVRIFDTAKVYRSETLFKKWFEQAPEVRKQIFLVTKDMIRNPSDMLKKVDERLAALGTDFIDLYFIHGLGDEHSLDDAINLVKSQEFKETADAIRKSGKAKFIGFSSHHKDRAQIIQAAAEGGIVDAIMLQYRPWLDKDSPLNKAIDACLEQGHRPDLDEADRRQHVW